MARSTSPHPSISLMDIFIGSGRTIRRPTGPPRMRPRKGSGDPKPATPVKPSSNKAIAGSDAKSNSKRRKRQLPPSRAARKKKHLLAPNQTAKGRQPTRQQAKQQQGRRCTPRKQAQHAKAPSEEKAANDKEAGAKKSNGKKPEEPVASGSKPQLLLMKANGDNWNDIAAAINKSKKQTTRRFGEIKPGDWKAQKGGKHGIDKEGVVAEMKKDKPSEKQLSKVPKKDDKAVEVKPKPNAVEKMRKPEDAPTALLLAGKVQSQHDVRHRHAHQHDHHIHVHDTHESRPRREPHDTYESRPRRDKDRTHESRPRHRTQPVLDPTDSGYGSNHRSRHDLFSFGELQALSELIGKDMEGMWHRVSAAFFGMTGRRIPAEDIKEKFEGLEVE
ncbi:unnamed protein product [Aureobasidium pullulans]|nr:unnamed protein product [Aureobasidium pullulans]